MKTTIRIDCPFLLQSLRRLLPMAVLGAAVLAGAAEPKPAGPGEPKTHTLFMGADISVEYQKKMYRVESVVEGAVVIRVDGKPVKVEADWSKVKLKVDRTLKLTGTSAKIDQLKGERAYSPGNDPWENYQKGLVQAEAQHAQNAFDQRDLQDARLALELDPPSTDPTEGSKIRHDAALRKAEHRESYTHFGVFGQGENLQRTGLETEGKESFDSMRITFEISGEPLLSDPYVVILGQFHDVNDKPNTVANWFYAQPLSAITTESRKIKILKTGLPPGFESLDFQVHLYNRGKEIATDVAPKRVALTRDEAHTYALLEYMSSNKGKNIPAKPFMGKLSKEAKAQLSTEQLIHPYYVKVSKEGRPIASYLDTSCSRETDTVVAGLIENARFYPALEKGKAIEGVAELKFGDLAL